ncbi:MAG: geranylgeranylglyceryl/heptaprenylglyceryl phosphate synthase [Desulfurococcales archaeon]|jgi:phosphoglycerol geranylgeranyltransferase|nr:geranylgeranylglyceryl/heptaprenylglyceryl phosphate synthase [Desulfurococcales archaeon]
MREERSWRGIVEEYLRSKARRGEKAVFILVDPDPSKHVKNGIKDIPGLIRGWDIDAILVGGSLGVSEAEVDRAVSILRDTGLPIILFPGNVNGISSKADAILFMSLLNSADPYYIIGAQVIGAPIVKRYGLEALPTAYVLMGSNTAVSHIGWARPIPEEVPEIASAYAMAAELLGMRFIYLEGGSGASKPVSPDVVRSVRRSTNLYIIAGGGIRETEAALEILKAGADAIVLGTILERNPEKAREIVKRVKSLSGIHETQSSETGTPALGSSPGYSRADYD